MKVSYNWLQSFFTAKLPKPEDLAELFTMHALEVGSVERRGADFLLDIDVLSNRAHDCLSHVGIAREIAMLTGSKISQPKMKVPKNSARSKKVAGKLHIAIDDKSLCRRYMGQVVHGVAVNESPRWLKERLESIGQKSINNIVDATNFVMFELGQPLHAFDADQIQGGITVRRAREGEKITTLDGEEVALNKNILIIADEKSPLAIAGVKGGKRAEITAATKNIVLEAANFESANVRRTSRTVGIVTDASVRFASGLDSELVREAMERLSGVVRSVAGGTEYATTDVYPKKSSLVKIKLSPDKLSAVLGVRIPGVMTRKILEGLGCKISASGKYFLVTVPTRRLDLVAEEDLIEEVGRIFGYEKIPPRHMSAEVIVPSRDDRIYYRMRAKDLLAGMGFAESYNYSFVGENELTLLGAPHGSDIFKLVNPTRPEFAFLRPTLICGLIKNLRDNLKHAAYYRTFETGRIFYKKESESIALAVAALGWKDSSAAFLELKGILAAWLESFGVENFWLDDVPESAVEYVGGGGLLHPFQRSEIKIGDETLGVIGTIHPSVAEAYKLKGKAAVCELDFGRLALLVREENEYMHVSRFPAVARDIALLVPADVRMSEVSDIIENSGGKLLKDADLFDVYEGKELPEDRKSFAFHLMFQSNEKTLSDAEVDGIMANIVNNLEENEEWEVRR